jgi:hydrogenase nickel incorporation protein HypA/HybF
MHELAICQALIAQVEDIASRRDARVRHVRIGIGPLCGVEAQLLADAYPLACAGTPAEGSQLEIEATLPRVRCRSCGTESVVATNRLVCGACGDWKTDLLAGDEMLLLSVELELPEPAIGGRHV